MSYELPNRCLFFFGQLEQTGSVPLRDYERVALSDGESVEERQRELALHPDAVLFKTAKRTVVLVHELNRSRQS